MRHAHARAVILFLAAATIAAGFAYASDARRSALRAPQRAIDDVEAIRTELRASIRSRGPSEAYAALQRDVAADDVPTRHGKAHVFGELLYAAAGLPGIAVCDGSFTFGCYHGLIVRALAAEGIAALPAIDTACVVANPVDDTGCIHGVGHGLVEHYGARDLASALAACETLRPPSLLGCTQGVFMEYAAAADAAVVPTTDSNEPCASAPAAHRPSCRFEQPYLWRRHYGADDETIAEFCTALSGRERDACLLGFGRMAVELSGYARGAAEASCGVLTPADRLTCLGGARWLHAALLRERPWPCDNLPDAERAACVTASRTISDVGQ